MIGVKDKSDKSVLMCLSRTLTLLMNEHFMQTFAVPGNWDKKEMGGHPAQSVCTTRIMSIEVMDRPQDCKLQSLLSPFNGEAWWTATCLSRNRV